MVTRPSVALGSCCARGRPLVPPRARAPQRKAQKHPPHQHKMCGPTQGTALLPPPREDRGSSFVAQIHRSVTMKGLDDGARWQRNAIVLIVLYFLGGVLYYSKLAMPEHFALVDALYFVVVR